ncbi:MAG: hypothetical protein HN929_06140 [Chloroflexi bacterium]|jgi:hypothetical protein|nr:hypothetical protein [Chloroflexota bacterium]MBT7081029.1 hypothetical protein [Chloroflexota bacterium]MBT7289202.1 hypothetical protein [Chloroflexota bacterium]
MQIDKTQQKRWLLTARALALVGSIVFLYMFVADMVKYSASAIKPTLAPGQISSQPFFTIAAIVLVTASVMAFKWRRTYGIAIMLISLLIFIIPIAVNNSQFTFFPTNPPLGITMFSSVQLQLALICCFIGGALHVAYYFFMERMKQTGQETPGQPNNNLLLTARLTSLLTGIGFFSYFAYYQIKFHNDWKAYISGISPADVLPHQWQEYMSSYIYLGSGELILNLLALSYLLLIALVCLKWKYIGGIIAVTIASCSLINIAFTFITTTGRIPIDSSFSTSSSYGYFPPYNTLAFLLMLIAGIIYIKIARNEHSLRVAGSAQ